MNKAVLQCPIIIPDPFNIHVLCITDGKYYETSIHVKSSNRKQKPEHKVTVMSMDENNLIRRL